MYHKVQLFKAYRLAWIWKKEDLADTELSYLRNVMPLTFTAWFFPPFFHDLKDHPWCTITCVVCGVCILPHCIDNCLGFFQGFNAWRCKATYKYLQYYSIYLCATSRQIFHVCWLNQKEVTCFYFRKILKEVDSGTAVNHQQLSICMLKVSSIMHEITSLSWKNQRIVINFA